MGATPVSYAAGYASVMDQDAWWKDACHLAVVTDYARNTEEVRGARSKGVAQVRRRKVCV